MLSTFTLHNQSPELFFVLQRSFWLVGWLVLFFETTATLSFSAVCSHPCQMGLLAHKSATQSCVH